jgi:hypothetical protein
MDLSLIGPQPTHKIGGEKEDIKFGSLFWK